MKINEIFCSINGESAKSGLRTVFVRTFGCISPYCNFCDTMYAVEGNDFTDMSVSEVIEKVDEFDCNRVTLTGGEPLIQSDALSLIEELVYDGYEVEIETNGAVDLSNYAKMNPESVLITMDWKCPSSGMNHLMNRDNLDLLRPSDVIKFVVASQEDLDEMNKISGLTAAQSYVSPVFGKIEPRVIAEHIIDNNLNDTRLQLQQHKIIFPINMRGV